MTAKIGPGVAKIDDNDQFGYIRGCTKVFEKTLSSRSLVKSVAVRHYRASTHNPIVKRFPAPRSPISETLHYVRNPHCCSSDHR